MAVIKVVDANQFDSLFKEHEYILVDFYADWCPPCRMMLPIIDRLSEDPDLQKITFVKVNVDENPMLADQFGIQGIPTFILFKSTVKSQIDSESQNLTQGDNYEIIGKFVGGQEPLGFKTKLLEAVK